MTANSADNRPNLADLVRDITGLATEDNAGAPPTSRPAPSGAELSLADLISDDNGEIVFFNDSGFRTLSIETDASVVSSGQSTKHVTAGGENVEGFNYVTFENGLTLYFENDLDLILPEG